ncbi:hypothetical protein MUK42_22282 [Musa troglodytarum]|uniref:Uncharacterized protein n=1 Tax=Musa troglodytarum TaxID=320322 RepID=A0A9E7KCS4_9LILI|nr:hypothetical protein MUK42_22282 [Musa troglodytarum]
MPNPRWFIQKQQNGSSFFLSRASVLCRGQHPGTKEAFHLSPVHGNTRVLRPDMGPIFHTAHGWGPVREGRWSKEIDGESERELLLGRTSGKLRAGTGRRGQHDKICRWGSR